ncbi:unnamed protein product [Nesidiocoris tenuis]|uniref:Uncharacterized protein n=1 Tax=Nesidiocoris tenuis TaxID=355587 RepID=A0A6H5HR87_9HEMI|nr:unnamed protein product [Nesidiocoris tenuis]
MKFIRRDSSLNKMRTSTPQKLSIVESMRFLGSIVKKSNFIGCCNILRATVIRPMGYDHSLPSTLSLVIGKKVQGS